MSWKVRVDACGWMLKLDRHGLALLNVDQVAHTIADHCHHADDDVEVVSGQPEPEFYRVDRAALWSLLEDAAIEAHNGSTPIQAADAVFADLTLAATEANAGDEQ